ncbi:MAG: 7-carboxy-7-deazaguanine synthase QueE [Desulfuromonadales bacterium]|nr:7-carboxy-7-deazaguanine synthase QueE [Desulfuromonadales bacterium]
MPAPATPKAELIEVFSSIQGEGVLVGHRQIFVRMAWCNLDCAYCDTPFARQDLCLMETRPGGAVFDTVTNPVSLELLLERIKSWLDLLPGAHHSLSMTGGEPLIQVDVLEEWLPVLRRYLPIYLETNGTLVAELERVLPHLDWISMDIKLPSVSGTSPLWDLHRDFLRLARTRNCFVKAVVSEKTTDEELLTTARLVADTAPGAPLILQPLTTAGGIKLSAGQLLEMQARVAGIHPAVRIIPQTHHFLSVL